VKRRSTRQSGFFLCLLTQAGSGGGGTFPTPTPPAAATAGRVLYAPNFTAGPTGLDPYRPWSVVTIDGVFFLANGYDTNKRWDGAAAFYPMGSTAPTTFALALSSAGSPAAIATGTCAVYYVVFANAINQETAPQLAAAGDVSATGSRLSLGSPGIAIANATGSTRDVTITWTDPGGEWIYARIYRRLQSSDNFKLVVQVAASTATYLDVSPDSAIRTNTAYVYTYRTTLPPILSGLAVVKGRMFGWQAGTSTAYYAQPVSVGSIFVAADFKSDFVLPIGPNDGRGDIVHLRALNGSAIWYKQRGRYEMTGSDPTNWDFSLLSGDRGLISQRCSVELDARCLNLDERGLYYDLPTGETFAAGAKPGVASPFQPIWDRMNVAARSTFFALHDPTERLVYFFIALDYEPVPNVAVVYDYVLDRFVSLDVCVWGTTGGVLYDAAGRPHVLIGCDLGYLWETNYSAGQGVTTGTTRTTITGGGLLALVSSTATFVTTTTAGVPGVPFYRLSAAGAVLDTNRVYSATSTSIVPYYYSPTAPTNNSDVLSLGIIPAVAKWSKYSFMSDAKKSIKEVMLLHGNGVDGSLDVSTGKDDDALSAKLSVSLATNVRSYVPCNFDSCWQWTIQFSQSDANLGFSLRGVFIHYKLTEGVRK